MKRSVIILLICVSQGFAVHAQNAPSSKYSFGVRISGKGKPMILIPGFKGSADTYNDVVAHYAAHYKCFVITLAGFAGQPATGELDHPFKTQRDEIIRYITDQHLHKPVLVGFSFGGILALWIASTRPDLIGSLIELDGVPFDAAIENLHVNKDSLYKDAMAYHDLLVKTTPAYMHHEDSVRHTAKFRKSNAVYLTALVTDTNRINQILDWDEASDYKTAWLMDAETEDLDLRDSVWKIKSPILVLGSWRTWHNLGKQQVEERYRLQYAPAKNVTIAFSENGKHFLMYEDFDWMIGQMDQFLKKN